MIVYSGALCRVRSVLGGRVDWIFMGLYTHDPKVNYASMHTCSALPEAVMPRTLVKKSLVHKESAVQLMWAPLDC